MKTKLYPILFSVSLFGMLILIQDIFRKIGIKIFFMATSMCCSGHDQHHFFGDQHQFGLNKNGGHLWRSRKAPYLEKQILFLNFINKIFLL